MCKFFNLCNLRFGDIGTASYNIDVSDTLSINIVPFLVIFVLLYLVRVASLFDFDKDLGGLGGGSGYGGGGGVGGIFGGGGGGGGLFDGLGGIFGGLSGGLTGRNIRYRNTYNKNTLNT